LVIGRWNRFTKGAFGGIVTGELNTISNEAVTVSGGFFNTASGVQASVSGGNGNTASGLDAALAAVSTTPPAAGSPASPAAG